MQVQNNWHEDEEVEEAAGISPKFGPGESNWDTNQRTIRCL